MATSNTHVTTVEEIEARLHRRFSSIDKEVLSEFAYAVSIHKYSYTDAKRMLSELAVISSVQSAVSEAIEEENEKERKRLEQKQRRHELELEQERHEASLRKQGTRQSVPTSMVHSTSELYHTSLDEVRNAGIGDCEVVLYVTSMTHSRQVRDHCRLLHNLLYIKRVKFTELDIADNAFLQKRLQRMVSESSGHRHSCQSNSMPLLFVGEKFVGNYEHCQALEDEGVLLAALQSHGFVYVPQPLPALQSDDGDDSVF